MSLKVMGTDTRAIISQLHIHHIVTISLPEPFRSY